MAASKLIANPRIQRFAGSARRYCSLIEKHSKLPTLKFIDAANRALIDLHSAALDLPNVRGGNDVPHRRMTTKQWQKLFRSLGRKLGKRNLYWQVFDCSKDEPPVCGSLADDLAGIYHDVDEGVKLFADGRDSYVREAVWRWKFNFMIHWGKHLVEAMTAMHRILSEESMKR